MSSNFWSHHLGDLLFFSVATLIAARAIAWNYIKEVLAFGWPNAQGRVEWANVEARHARYFTYYIARLDYSYRVKGEYFSGYVVRAFILEGSADRFVAAMKNQIVYVRANPLHPDRSALLKQDQPGGWPA